MVAIRLELGDVPATPRNQRVIGEAKRVGNDEAIHLAEKSATVEVTCANRFKGSLQVADQPGVGRIALRRRQ